MESSLSQPEGLFPLTRVRKELLIIAGSVLGFLFLIGFWTLGLYRQERLDFCSTCGSKRHVEFRRILSEGGPRTPFTSDYEHIEESRVLRDLLDAGHEHAWVMSWLELDGMGGVRATGWGHRAPLHAAYEEDPDLREFLRRKVASGAVTKEQLRLLFAQPASGFLAGREVPPPAPRPGEAALLEGTRAALAEYRDTGGGKRGPGLLEAWSDRQPPPRK